ncbi:unnamed protein product [Calypogeia fissa]
MGTCCSSRSRGRSKPPETVGPGDAPANTSLTAGDSAAAAGAATSASIDPGRPDEVRASAQGTVLRSPTSAANPAPGTEAGPSSTGDTSTNGTAGPSGADEHVPSTTNTGAKSPPWLSPD